MCAAPMEMITVGGQRADPDVLVQWADGLRRQKGKPERGLLRFALYGRVSTEDWQDPESSRARQLQQAVMLVAGRGVIVAEFFDAGQTRVLPWPRRPPYGYRLADAGPHPNKAHAAWGRRAHKLEPDPGTAPVVSRCSRSGWPGTAPRGSPAL